MLFILFMNVVIFCFDKYLGDINLDCVFDIVDVVFISGYIIVFLKF